jgi:hypothetical protein
MLFHDLFPARKPLIGMVHLPPLPGYSGFPGMDALIRHVEEEVRVLEQSGFDGVLIENENDQPHKVLSAPETTAAMAVLVRHAVNASRRITVGAEILLNDPKASLAAAFVGGAQFIRTDYFVDRMERPEYGGEMTIDPDGLLNYRADLGADDIAVLADIQVKYARMIEPRPIADSAILAREKGADAIIVSGNFTGVAPDTIELEKSVHAVEGMSVLIGSGLNVGNARQLLTAASGAIVGTGIMTGGRVCPEKAAALVAIRNEIIE